MRAGSSSTRISRSTPPTRATDLTPRTESIRFAIPLSTNQESASSSIRGDATVYVRIGAPARLTLVTTGSRRSPGSEERTRDTASRTPSTASRRDLEPELDRDRHRTRLHRRVDVLDALQRRDRVLDRARDLGLHLRRARAGQRRGHGHGGQVDVRELLDLHRAKAQTRRRASTAGTAEPRGSGCGSTRTKTFIADASPSPERPAPAGGTTRTRSPSARKPAPEATTRASDVEALRSPPRDLRRADPGRP